jgi:surfeit locus 1 family protein
MATGAFSILPVLFKRRWILTTLLVIAAVLVMGRLGIWQLDRLAQRKDHNARLSQGLAQPPLNLNGKLPADMTAMEYYSARATGHYDFSQEVLLRNQYSQEGQPGFHLLTPLSLDGSSQAVLVDRGWIPLDQSAPAQRAAYAENGTLTVSGMLRRSQPEPSFGAVPDAQLAAGQTRLDFWLFINLERIAAQVERPLISVYLIAAPDPARSGLPQRKLPEIDLSEGPHLGYAGQWFLFATILLIGYPTYVGSQLKPRKIKP